MNRPPLEVADIIRSAGESLLEKTRRWITWQQPQGPVGYPALPHGCARRSSQSLLRLRPRCHLIQLVWLHSSYLMRLPHQIVSSPLVQNLSGRPPSGNGKWRPAEFNTPTRTFLQTWRDSSDKLLALAVCVEPGPGSEGKEEDEDCSCRDVKTAV
jgi:hypothetical protein